MQLPVVGRPAPPGAAVGGGAAPHAEAPDDARAGAGLGPDPRRLAQGWEHRFVATGDRVEEMVGLYRELGFEVVADPVGGEGLDAGCEVCFSGQLRYHAIYTRRRGAPQDPSQTGD
ncbi:MAG TPA: hypothetical protein VLA43_18730 [Longimicrobiales bacterium]|nr:hypothetical protein [Longimicrobiales bacterium]